MGSGNAIMFMCTHMFVQVNVTGILEFFMMDSFDIVGRGNITSRGHQAFGVLVSPINGRIALSINARKYGVEHGDTVKVCMRLADETDSSRTASTRLTSSLGGIAHLRDLPIAYQGAGSGGLSVAEEVVSVEVIHDVSFASAERRLRRDGLPHQANAAPRVHRGRKS